MPAPTDDQLLERPIIILGAPRSGTSFLTWSISEHRDLAFFDEPRLTWMWGNHGKSDMLKPRDANPEIVAHIRKTFAAGVREQGKQRMFEKTPSNSLRVGFIEKIFPDARYVHILRHGVDSVLSIAAFWRDHATGMGGKMPQRLRERLKEVPLTQLPRYAGEAAARLAPEPIRGWFPKNVWGPRIPGVRGLMRDLDPLEVAALQWRTCVEAACHDGRRLPPERYMECRLEDMGEDLIARVIRFCGLDDDPAVWAALKEKFEPDLAGARRRDADPATVEQVLRWIQPTLDWLGYDAEGAP